MGDAHGDAPKQRKAYGMVTALGTKLAGRAKADPTLVPRIRETPDLDAFRALVRHEAAGLVPPALVDAFLDEAVTDADWVQWRARLLIQVKMVLAGEKPAPGHEAGRGVGRP